MRKSYRSGLMALAATLALATPVLADQPAKAAPAASAAELPAPRQFVTRHTTTIRGQKIAYTAIAGETYLTDRQGKPTASFFSFSYIKDGPRDPTRPVTFIFNGGPGSSSIWLHLGIIGPRRVVLSNEVNPKVIPPFGLRDNPYSPLDVSDLVFIDPVGTGFSRALGDKTQKDFFSVDADALSVAQFIESWLTSHGRWNSPKFVVGESYGSVRAAVLPRALMGGVAYGEVMRAITLNGIVLLGTTLEPRDTPPSEAETTALGFPSVADTAWYHQVIDRKGRTLEAFDAEAKAFAGGEYLSAMTRLDAGTLPPSEARAVAEKAAAFTGQPVNRVLDNKLRVQARPFARQVLAERRQEVGMYDSRYTLPTIDRNHGGDNVADDPAMAQYTPGFVGAFHDLLTEELKVDMPMAYSSIVWKGLAFDWDWKRSAPASQSFATDLAVAMRRNPDLRLLVASGYYDLVTPPAAAESSLQRAGVPADRTTYRFYESGHMLYLGGTAEAFSNDVRTLITGRK